MAQNITWTMKRGEYKTRKVWVKAADYTAGGKLFFTAKPDIDSDPTDSKAIIDIKMTDDNIVETNTAGDKAFLLVIDNAATKDLQITESTEYYAEFQYVNDIGQPITYPDDNSFKLEIIPDVKIGIA
jgi:hypothetical protein